MTKSELVELLKDFPDDMPVCFAYSRRDYWRQVVAPEIRRAELEYITHSVYCNESVIVEINEETSDEKKEASKLVIVMR